MVHLVSDGHGTNPLLQEIVTCVLAILLIIGARQCKRKRPLSRNNRAAFPREGSCSARQLPRWRDIPALVVRLPQRAQTPYEVYLLMPVILSPSTASFDKGSFDQLISVYSSMNVHTYSSSASIINRAAEEMERLEIAFGRPDILGNMASHLHFQELLLKELIDATRGKDFIKVRIESGAIKLYVVQDIISHTRSCSC